VIGRKKMTGEKFTLMQYPISAILGFIEGEDFVIPEIQRPFVWKRSQVRDLIDSLYNGYPTGYIITWKNPDVKTKDGGKSNGKHVLISLGGIKETVNVYEDEFTNTYIDPNTYEIYTEKGGVKIGKYVESTYEPRNGKVFNGNLEVPENEYYLV
jgi:hypothetical protein